ncbi:L-lactate dehydrogenase [Oxalobacteraceae bacterium R-40]|uniref:L-lactate dehydrogenase n=1 Tax=Keguizhuia sedimenti TaxID=3064264 RepID=A0ABU1BU68_9BURK|nr:L-lactate dehydrogenase [Oxalobacteraceae bacterium R-40]
MNKGTKIAIVGAGRVGSTLAYTLAASGIVREIVLIDADRLRAEGEAMDIVHAVAFSSPVTIKAGEMVEAAGAALTVIAAGAAQQVGESRRALLQRNAAVLRGMIPEIVRINPEGLLLIATNPVDALTAIALRLSGLPSMRVFGSGTVLDTARLRAELSTHYAVDARNVHAYVLGEHGDSELVAWSSARLATVPLNEFCKMAAMSCTSEDMAAMESRVREAAYQIIRRKGATNFAIAKALMRIIEAVVRDEGAVLTVSTLVEGQYGIQGVCLSLPAVIDASGIRLVIRIPLSKDEEAHLVQSAAAVRAMLESIEHS